MLRGALPDCRRVDAVQVEELERVGPGRRGPLDRLVQAAVVDGRARDADLEAHRDATPRCVTVTTSTSLSDSCGSRPVPVTVLPASRSEPIDPGDSALDYIPVADSLSDAPDAQSLGFRDREVGREDPLAGGDGSPDRSRGRRIPLDILPLAGGRRALAHRNDLLDTAPTR